MVKRATEAEKEIMAAVKKSPCIVCGAKPISECHHICDTGRRLGHSYVLPLCTTCHRGEHGFTGRYRDKWDKSLKNQLELMKQVYAKLGKKPPVYAPKVNFIERM